MIGVVFEWRFVRCWLVIFLSVLPVHLIGQTKVPLPASTGKDAQASLKSIDAPHTRFGINCSSCHMTHQSADVQLTMVEGNANLCMSCHNPAGLASSKPFADAY
ncbi:MAG: cytochrome c3 family protein [bacterium]